MPVPNPTPIYRLIHVDNLHVCLRRGGLHAPRYTPDDGLVYKTIHNVDIQTERRDTYIPCGPRGVIHDYVPFYFGPRSPMLYRLHTRWKTDYTEGQEPLIYLVSTAQQIQESGASFVFSDGHGIARLTDWFGDLDKLDEVDWNTVYATRWKDDVADNDRQRRKQAEFLVYRFCDWRVIHEIGVFNDRMRRVVEDNMSQFSSDLQRVVRVKPDWYYYT